MTKERELLKALLESIDQLPFQYDWKGRPVGPLADFDDTAAEAARAYLNATPEPAEGPTDEEIDAMLPLGMAPYSTLCGPIEIRAFARAVLARWRHQPPRPIPLSERLPGSEDMTDEHWSCHWCWWGRRFAGGWEWHQGGNGYGTVPGEFSHWLPHHALPLRRPTCSGARASTWLPYNALLLPEAQQ